MAKTMRPRDAIAETLPAEERIRQRAYDLYVERGNEPGSELDDWIQAEQEILWYQNQEPDANALLQAAPRG